MVFSIRRWTSRIFFIIIFTLLLCLVTGSYRWLADAISPVHPYREPKGASLKVFVTDPGSPDSKDVADRLRWFYWYGE
ncbi:YqzK family protein [Paenibacillus sinopodophylli]|uniref:YqzK family protein n=1 Tax=Paenibacillus sinopodophylli TaxID=1837342 RepID=UPI00110CE202|nr:YqzK family protein [Paenibacillus sinopodophylli]